MRFSLDCLVDSDDEREDETFAKNDYSSCSSPGSSININEISFVNPNEEDEDVPQLYLPKKKLVPFAVREQSCLSDVNFESLDPELERLIQRLDLQAKLPARDGSKVVVVISRPTEAGKKETSSMLEEAKDVACAGPERMLSAIESSFSSRLEALELENKKQVERMRLLKRQKEEERRRREQEERRKREEEERRKREEEALRRRELEEEVKRKEEAERLKRQQEEAEAKKEEAKRKAEEEEKLKQEAIRSKTVSDFGLIEQKFRRYKEKIVSIKRNIIEPVKKADPALKTLLSRHKRKVNPKFGQLTNSNAQLQNIQRELCTLVDQTKDNQLAFLWILNFIAKAMVRQAETEVRVKPESALPLGKLAVNLMVQYPELKELLMARFVKKCPFVIGYTCSIDSESGRQDMGWKRKADDKWEEDTFYDERMGGMITLFAVITRLPLPQEHINTQSHPMPISNSWHMIARIANTPRNLLTNSHFVVLGFWWDAAASEFIEAYGNQGNKLLQLIGENLTASVAERKYVGAARLRILLEEWHTTGIKTFPELVA
ncbi:hypothetical protein HG536_0H01790 [Torulaspora globosa]|uniref:mRNA export factor GLE1 n=1 Tax=Torulaspora globosa TaxID=48254 RepID=A0A7G3ZMR8_9SACH|nr:uncharacterized protein HG536_0H01790 [Torulaspora globosa]QLL34804.1 hypothetical protein HG536_0H01790 [Torulaspora globosa]